MAGASPGAVSPGDWSLPGGQVSSIHRDTCPPGRVPTTMRRLRRLAKAYHGSGTPCVAREPGGLSAMRWHSQCHSPAAAGGTSKGPEELHISMKSGKEPNYGYTLSRGSTRESYRWQP